MPAEIPDTTPDVMGIPPSRLERLLAISERHNALKTEAKGPRRNYAIARFRASDDGQTSKNSLEKEFFHFYKECGDDIAIAINEVVVNYQEHALKSSRIAASHQENPVDNDERFVYVHHWCDDNRIYAVIRCDTGFDLDLLEEDPALKGKLHKRKWGQHWINGLVEYCRYDVDGTGVLLIKEFYKCN